MLQDNKNIVVVETESGNINLTPQTVKKYLVSGDGNVSDQEVMMFMQLCKFRKLNPFLREVYLIKFGNEAATLIVGKDSFTKRAAENAKCAGWEAGIIVKNSAGDIQHREGTFIADDEKLIGGWAKIHRHNWSLPLSHTVSFAEFARRKKDGSLMSTWKNMGATMIRKVALVQALRETFPETIGGMYSEEEMLVDNSKLDRTPVILDAKKENPAGINEQEGELLPVLDLDELLTQIKDCKTMDELQDRYQEGWKAAVQSKLTKSEINKIVAVKDKRKAELDNEVDGD